MYPEVSFSIISHGQGEIICNLLDDLRKLKDVSYEIILTVNIRESMNYVFQSRDLPIKVLENKKCKGFGANHNSAFAEAQGHYFVALNPDIRLITPEMKPLIDALGIAGTGVCGPKVISPSGDLEDHARKFPTIKSLFSRILFDVREPDYTWDNDSITVDWIAGMFMIFPSNIFKLVGGFNEKYFMYYEDVDICFRLKNLGLKTVVLPTVTVIHEARRSSHKKLNYLVWHIRSTIRYLFGI